MDIKYLISLFEENYKDKYEEDEKLRQTFIEKFPIDSLGKLELERYALGKEKDSLCWWLEFNTIQLGSIKGGSSKKFKIYYSKSNTKWIYPKEFKDERDAWNALRSSIDSFVKNYKNREFKLLNDNSLISSMNMFKTKLLYMYFPDELLPIYSLEHMKSVLKLFGYEENIVDELDVISANMKLKEFQLSSEEFKNWNGLKFMRFIYTMILNASKIYKVASGEDGIYWDTCFSNGYICIGWDEIGDLRNFNDYGEFKSKFEEAYGDFYNHKKSKITEKANELWKFFNLESGDKIVANKGIKTILGVGIVSDKGYYFDNERKESKHIVYVNWDKQFKSKNIEPQKGWAFKAITDVSEKLYEKIYKNENLTNQSIINENDIFTEREEKFFNNLKSILNKKGNVILYGPPGTGKTYLSNQYLRWLSLSENIEINMCTFHPSFNYEDFIEGYKPQSKGNNVVFNLTDGIFKSICKKAKNDKYNNYYLIIDEINRGNIEKIFGELITLIEKDKRGLNVKLSQSKEDFCVPDNIFIIGTMNTADKSIKMLDAAIRRRFSFIECMPNYELIDTPIEKIGISPKQILSDINRSLRRIEDREKQIGHSYFMNKSKQIESIEDLKQVYIYDIIPLVSEYCYNDYDNMSEIIGENFIDKDSQELKEELIYGTEDFFAMEIVSKFGESND